MVFLPCLIPELKMGLFKALFALMPIPCVCKHVVVACKALRVDILLSGVKQICNLWYTGPYSFRTCQGACVSDHEILRLLVGESPTYTLAVPLAQV